MRHVFPYQPIPAGSRVICYRAMFHYVINMEGMLGICYILMNCPKPISRWPNVRLQDISSTEKCKCKWTASAYLEHSECPQGQAAEKCTLGFQ